MGEEEHPITGGGLDAHAGHIQVTFGSHSGHIECAIYALVGLFSFAGQFAHAGHVQCRNFRGGPHTYS
jgi:hypothetical protein